MTSPYPPSSRQTPPPSPTPESLQNVQNSIRFGPIQSVSGGFWRVLGCWVGSGWVRQRGFCKGKEYHYAWGRKNHDSQRRDRIPRFFLRLGIGRFSPHFGAISLLKCTENLEKLEKFHWRKFKKSNGDGAPKLQISVPSQRALRDRLMSRGKNCLPTVSRQFLTRNYPRPSCLLKCLPNCLSPTREGFLSSFKVNPAVRVITRQVRDKNLSRGNFYPATSICIFWPTGLSRSNAS